MHLKNTWKALVVRRLWLKAIISLAIAGLVVACAGSTVRTAVPGVLSSQVSPVGMSDVRFWGDESPPNLDAIVKEKFAQMRATRPQLFKAGSKPLINFLTVSGGGSDGAFGAGLLVGWSDAGTRPEFELVTGVSTGALIAPFAFLGKRYDPTLKEMYTTYSTGDFVTKHAVRGLLGGVANRAAFVARAAEASSLSRAFALRRRIELTGVYHTKVARITSFVTLGGVPMLRTTNGVVAILPIDFLPWTKKLAQMVNSANKDKRAFPGSAPIEVWITGRASRKTASNLKKSSWRLVENAGPRLGD